MLASQNDQSNEFHNCLDTSCDGSGCLQSVGIESGRSGTLETRGGIALHLTNYPALSVLARPLRGRRVRSRAMHSRRPSSSQQHGPNN